MGAKSVYLVHYIADGSRLAVTFGGRADVPMEEFVQTHIPLQVSSLTNLNPDNARTVVGLMIAEEVAAPNTAKLP